MAEPMSGTRAEQAWSSGFAGDGDVAEGGGFHEIEVGFLGGFPGAMGGTGVCVRADGAEAEEAGALGHVSFEEFDDADDRGGFRRDGEAVAARVAAHGFDDAGVAKGEQDFREIVARDAGSAGEFMAGDHFVAGLGGEIGDGTERILRSDGKH